jgi:hypothetical protein
MLSIVILFRLLTSIYSIGDYVSGMTKKFSITLKNYRQDGQLTRRKRGFNGSISVT